MGNGEINFSPSIRTRKSIIEEMEQWWGGMEKFLSDVDIITIRIFLRWKSYVSLLEKGNINKNKRWILRFILNREKR